MTFCAELTTWAPKQHCLALHGKLDSLTRAEFEPQALELAAQEGGGLVLDCTKLDYVASAGLRVFLMAAKRAQQAGGKMVLSGLQASVREVLEISGFLKILTVVDSLEQARALTDSAN